MQPACCAAGGVCLQLYTLQPERYREVAMRRARGSVNDGMMSLHNAWLADGLVSLARLVLVVRLCSRAWTADPS